MKITFPDGAVREYEEGSTAMDIAKNISEGLARKILASEVNGEVWDLSRPIKSDSNIKFLTWDDEKAKSTFWHSSAHLMAEAVEDTFPGVKFWVGPPIEKGFYYDMDLGENEITESDLGKLEKKMTELSRQNNVFLRKEISKNDAIKYFEEKGDEYKLDLLSGLEDGNITFYTQGQFTDLCRGPHIPTTGLIKGIKLTSIAGAYWKGDEKNKMLTRIYGITFPNQKELDKYLVFLEEAKKRDHRKLGKEKLERGYHCGCQKAQCFVKGFNSFCRKHNLNLDIFQLSLHILVPKIYMLPVGTMKNMERTVFNLSKLQLREKSFFLNP